MITGSAVLLVILSGIAFSGIMITYRTGQHRGIPMSHIGLFLLLGAGLFFGLRTDWSAVAACPALIYAIGLGSGLTQYAQFRVIVLAMHRGPLSPVNCALFLGFVLVILFSWLCFGETLSVLQALGVASAVACVLFGSFLGTGKPGAGGAHTPRQYLEYGFILILLFVLNSLTNISFKYLSMVPEPGDGSLMHTYGMFNLMLLYAGLFACLLVEILLQKPAVRTVLRGFVPGLIGAACSATGLWITSSLAYLPAAFVFPVSAITSILSGAIVSVTFFHERMTRAWWGMMAMGTLTAALLIADALWSGLSAG